jgi:hypothetical protein
VKTKIMVLELLTTVCMVPPHGHRHVPPYPPVPHHSDRTLACVAWC